jgi:hypothetical protein
MEAMIGIGRLPKPNSIVYMSTSITSARARAEVARNAQAGMSTVAL